MLDWERRDPYADVAGTPHSPSAMVFSDGVSQQMTTVTGTPSSGLTSTLTIAVSGAV